MGDEDRSGSRAVVYVGNAETQDITLLELGPDGELDPIRTIAVPGPPTRGGSLPLALRPDGRFLFAGLRGGPFSVASFAVDRSSGQLSYVGAGPLAASMAHLSVDARGRFLLAASYDDSLVTTSPIGDDGVVGSPLQQVPTKPKAHFVHVTPSNRHVLHTSLGGDGVHQQRFDPETGRLSPNEPPFVRSVKPGSGPRHLAFSPDERFVYVVNELDGGIDGFSFDAADGTLHEGARIGSALPPDFTGKPWAADIHLTPDGRFLYASERTSSTIAAFEVRVDDGRLAWVCSYPTATQPRAFAIDPTGRHLLAAGQRSDSVRVHRIEASGALAEAGDHPVGKNPTWIEILPLP